MDSWPVAKSRIGLQKSYCSDISWLSYSIGDTGNRHGEIWISSDITVQFNRRVPAERVSASSVFYVNLLKRIARTETLSMILRKLLTYVPVIFFFLLLPTAIISAQQETEQDRLAYTIQPGDKLQISVWNEPDLQKELLVAPDGGIAFPLVGEISVIGKSIVELREEISTRLSRFISEPMVTVTVSEVLGNSIYVLGQVRKPGQYVVNPMVDVMQALSMAGGTTPFASLNNILILRRRGSQQVAISFKYGDVSSGRNLELNIVLQSGDVVVVP